ncbi:hypothetical protein [Deinococcus altitudinis]|uniref:hypothetical protein n=1 Tax=Deinococcus altitudinis TaxID=468914 RepID=UPI003891CA22
MSSVLADLLSHSNDRVLTSSSLINHTRDSDLLNTLAAALKEIRKATEHLSLGGMLFRNEEHVLQAIRVIENHQAGRCFCQVYPGYLFYDPAAEEKAGHVRVTRSATSGWSMTYECACTICGHTYAVQEGEYHYTWWDWRGPKNAVSS